MKELSLREYLQSPCSVSSIPYWKLRDLKLPDGVIVVHDKDYCLSKYVDFVDEPYFRLYHDLKHVEQIDMSVTEIVVATPSMTDLLVEIINRSYCDLSVTASQLDGYRKMRVYCPDLWILLKDRTSGVFVGSGIADYDKYADEMILEWVQVLPQYRGRGYGRAIVNYLLASMQNKAEFATVSGKVHNPTCPDRLYRSCGFTGNDIWHVLSKNKCDCE